MTDERKLQLITGSPEYKLVTEIRRLVRDKGATHFSRICDLVDSRWYEIYAEIESLTPSHKT